MPYTAAGCIRMGRSVGPTAALSERTAVVNKRGHGMAVILTLNATRVWCTVLSFKALWRLGVSCRYQYW
jgi:hypothetical protein